MTRPIEDYAVIGDCHTAALISSAGSIDWACLPRYDSQACFAALLGEPEHGRWSLRPVSPNATSTRSYQDGTLILQTEWTTPDGAVRMTEAMPLGDRRADIVRRIEGLRGTVRMHQELIIRFDYGQVMPWIRRVDDAGVRAEDGTRGPALLAVAGPDALLLRGGPMPEPTDHRHVGEFDVREGQTVDLTLTWYPSYRDVPPVLDVGDRLERTHQWWQEWSGRIDYEGPHSTAVVQSLILLRALTHEDTGGIVAAATTSLPEDFGGERNWDYRYCWLRDAALTLEALIGHGFVDEAHRWRDWLLRAVAGDPHDVQIMYGVGGERELPERELAHLPGYAGSVPVRIGNGAVDQYQADVIGEVLVALEAARCAGLAEDEFSWSLQRALLEFVEEVWEKPDHGIWEVRGPERRYTHSRVMLWAALDRGVKAVDDHGLSGPRERWAELREVLRTEIETHGWNPDVNSYVQHYGGSGVDASLLQLAQVGFCAPDDERMVATVARIESELMRGDLVLRYLTDGPDGGDGLDGEEHPFLVCCFWLVEQYARSGRVEDAETLLDRLCGLRNDVGILAEQYDPQLNRMAGNVPQAFSHLALVRAADAVHAARRQADLPCR